MGTKMNARKVTYVAAFQIGVTGNDPKIYNRFSKQQEKLYERSCYWKNCNHKFFVLHKVVKLFSMIKTMSIVFPFI